MANMATTAPIAPPVPSHTLPPPWRYFLSKSQGKYYYFNPESQRTLWPIEVGPSTEQSLQWGWELKNGVRTYANLLTGAVSSCWPPEQGDISGVPKRKLSHDKNGEVCEDVDGRTKRSREERSILADGSGVASSLSTLVNSEVEAVEGGSALRPPSDLSVSMVHLGVSNPDAPSGLSPIIPNAYIKALQEVAEVAGRGVGLPMQRPEFESYHHGWFFPPHKVVLSELLSPDTKLIVELGSWLGKSLFFMAERAPNAILVAIDLWDNTFIVNEQGDHYCNDERQVHILKTRPLYETFICNAWDKRHRIVPMKTTTERGVSMLVDVFRRHGIAPDLIYVDADHHYAPARRDIEACVRAFPKAHIVGDDYDYEEVRKAAHDLADEHGLQVHAEGGKCWTFSKVTGKFREEFGGGGGAGALPPAEQERFVSFSTECAAILGRDDSASSAAALNAVIQRFLPDAGRWLNSPLALRKGVCKEISLLQAAARLGRNACVAALLERWGCDVNSSTGKGKTTPLGQAAYFGHHTTVSLLLKRGADRGIKNGYGETPLEAARKEMRKEVVALLDPT